MELTVGATPGYFATMAAERWYLQRRARLSGAPPGPADYERRDTLASLTMGTASLVAPLVVPKVLGALVRRQGKVRKSLLAVTAAAVTATSAADWWSRRRLAGSQRAPQDLGNRRHRRLDRFARATSKVGGVASVVLGGVTATTLWAGWTTDRRMWHQRLVRDLGSGPVLIAAAVAGWDFLYYWNHRFMHESRFMWAIHVVHHSSQHYNLSTALRQPVADALGTFIPTGTLALAGVRPEVITTARGVNLLYQYWIHTELVQTLGPLERVLNTPSHHRVHHGSNRQYLDRNHGSILIVWDRLFGTFEPERDRVVYGLTKNINTFNPLRIASHEYADMMADVAASHSWRERLSYVVRGPGWAAEQRARSQASSAVDEGPPTALVAAS